ncbi:MULTISPECIES: endonuclease/exonuclease/phosphatase family protein [Flavobacterium]|uniref:Endonuclease/exonuclease/phosphatase family protein n=2 Tax=Flavobacterium TaxID=237 RepID=A0AA94JP41_9FLAO|nr:MULTISPECIES: endonuclease [Flavobacterium]OXA82785.1 endonuclease [Flavobacterium columnare] [Flavobacterium columnare NBRC 100251 = ATCC 23463]AMA48148.1 endonuclease [Flavobacterium covae]AND63714.1 endonuclease [Flavobacterium covae]MCH4830060.1 endonuclease/exonuclease/phosphatase family protein [Flavobacterium columnare]MCH4832560.1 endonuclease/exonuclease/phosphatase family protein [Flavobacterium columnare]
MKFTKITCLFFIMLAIDGVAQTKRVAVNTIAFYNLENFFDTVNDPNTNDEDFVYSPENYAKKIDNLARVISQLGTSDKQTNAPVVLGVAEIENRRVLEDLIKHPLLINLNYGIVHFDSPDRRGIDCGFLYQKKHFNPSSYQNYPLIISEDQQDSKAKDKDKNEGDTDENIVDVKTKRIYTRDQILMTGTLDGEEMSFIVNHWPSRRGGEKASSPLREAAAALNRKIIDSLQTVNPNAKIFTMGDLNDGPFNKSVKEILGAKGEIEEVKPQGLYNPAEKMLKKGIGTLAHRDAWDFFDQIIFTEALLPHNNDYSTWKYWKAGVYNKSFMIQQTGQYKGYALRNTSEGPGFSDHFPSYIYLVKEF